MIFVNEPNEIPGKVAPGEKHLIIDVLGGHAKEIDYPSIQ
jgi:hypothetical protein